MDMKTVTQTLSTQLHHSIAHDVDTQLYHPPRQCPSTDQFGIDTMEYYSALKNDILLNLSKNLAKNQQ